MTSLRRGVRLGLAVLGAGTMSTAAPGGAQTGTATGAFTERPDAALSRELRSLAANPKSVTALMGAGKAALDLGDPQAALTFFARAEEQLPRDGRVKMWIASALVQLQQPHAALKFFRDAADLGVPAADLARDRGLAQDIAGNPREAQRDYRMALEKGRDDEVTRRLALSLAISGEREPALRLLEDQLLVRDRAAERARALILALTGDTAGAARAVQTAMPGPQAGAMSPFLARLPTLSPAERALAVHLGVFPGDGRTAPPSAYAANGFASATDAGRPDPGQASLARRSPPPEPVSAEPRRRPGSDNGIAPAVRRSFTIRPVAKSGGEEAFAGVRQQPAAIRPAARPGREETGTGVRQKPAKAPAVAGPGREETLAGVRQPPTAAGRPSASPGFGGSNSAWNWSRGLTPSQDRPRSESMARRPEPAPKRAPSPPETAIAAPAPGLSREPVPTPVAQNFPPARIQPESQAQPAEVRAAGAAETSAPPPQQLDPTVKPQPAEVRTAAAEPSTPPPRFQAAPEAHPAEVRIAAAGPSAPPPRAEAIATGSRLADLSATLAGIAEPRAAAGPSAAKPKPAAKPQDGHRAASAEPAKKPKAAPAEPSRVWVQVAGGAAKTALPREFARLKAKAPKLLGARGAWTSPLNATNRLLVGPFASAGEAQAFVNQLKAQDISGFAWTSEAGDKVEKLPAK